MLRKKSFLSILFPAHAIPTFSPGTPDSHRPHWSLNREGTDKYGTSLGIVAKVEENKYGRLIIEQ